MNIYFLGPIGTFSHKLAKECYPNDKLIAVESFTEIFSNLNSNEDGIGIVPVENSTSSNVHENIDFLFSGEYEIKRETYLKISLNLYGTLESNLSDIKQVYSHPKALEQCSNFIASNSLNDAPIDSTAKALKFISKKKDNSIAAIGNNSDSKELKLLKENIGNENFNLTRFLHVTKKSLTNFDKTNGRKLSVLFKVPHVEGALAKVLSEIANLKVNLSKIESKPIPGSNFEYLFWVDLEIENDEVYDKLSDVLRKTTKDIKIVGRYNLGETLN